MVSVTDTLLQMRRNAGGVRFADLSRVCQHYFGEPRQKGSSHRIFRTPWPGDPRVNIQNERGMAKAYQVRQAIARLEAEDGLEE